MKRLFCIFVSLCLMAGLCACNREPDYESALVDKPSSKPASSAPESSSETSSTPEQSQVVSSSEEASSQEYSSQQVSSDKPSSSQVSSSQNSSQTSSSKPATSKYFDKDTLQKFSKLSTKSESFWYGTVKDSHNRPNGSMMFQKKYQQTQNLACIAPLSTDGNKRIYLTFDMGWEYKKSYTISILDTLKTKNVKAVFFVTKDYAKKSPDMIRRMIDEGHIVGNHSVSHPEMSKLSVDKMADEVIGLHNYIKEEFGYEMFLFRAPAGNFSEKVLGVCSQLGYKNVFWSFAYADWDVNNQPDPDDSYKLYMKCLHDGGIFLIHGLSKTNVNILGKVIDGARDAGFEPELYDFREVQIVS